MIISGHGRMTAMWATNVGNEHGQVIMSVLNEREGASLRPMITGLVSRYKQAAVNPPESCMLTEIAADLQQYTSTFNSGRISA